MRELSGEYVLQILFVLDRDALCEVLVGWNRAALINS